VNANSLLQLVSTLKSSKDLKVRANHIKDSVNAHWVAFSAERSLWLDHWTVSLYRNKSRWFSIYRLIDFKLERTWRNRPRHSNLHKNTA